VSLFEPDLPPGFAYRDGFITPEEESSLVAMLGAIEFDTFEMRGVVARRRVKFYGRAYDLARGPEEPIPPFLFPVRDRLAEWADVAPAAFAMALINEYRAGAPIGWHRDAPQYGITAGVSLLSACRMKLRPYSSPPQQGTRQESAGRTPRRTTHDIQLLPRSGYLITGAARQDYEHSIPAVEELRYSVTFRTLR
jgi:alkylated DNA repair dioxygenase AlkB